MFNKLLMKKIIVLFIVLLVVGAYLIKTNNALDVENKEDQKTFFKLFTSWISDLFENAKEITTLAVKQDWLPEEDKE
jgi:hypothetical protein